MGKQYRVKTKDELEAEGWLITDGVSGGSTFRNTRTGDFFSSMDSPSAFCTPDDGFTIAWIQATGRDHMLAELPDEGMDQARILVDGWFAGTSRGSIRGLGGQNIQSLPRCTEHHFVNMGFMHIKMVCKHCNQEKL